MTLHAVAYLRLYDERLLDDRTLDILHEQVVRERAEHFRVLATIEDTTARNEVAEAGSDELRGLDWALTKLNDEKRKRGR